MKELLEWLKVIKFPTVIDAFDNATERAYTGWPDRPYVMIETAK